MTLLAKILGIVGVLVVLLGIAGRFKGPGTVLGQFQAINVVIVGIAAMVAGVLAKLEQK